ncbi:MAG: hypothetical protein H6811_07105 [Phycisphaeraceae bacterium]|nr:hypothetical protein [Phycisphaeraceae bacterium]
MQRSIQTVAGTIVGVSVLVGAARADFDRTWDYKGGSRGLSLGFGADAAGFFVNQPVGAVEPDPTPADAFSIADSVRRAAASWNATASGWTINAAPAPGDIPITVRMGYIDPEHPENNEFEHPSSEQADNDGDGGGKSVLAYFRITGTDPTDGRFATSAEIVFNPFASWGVGTNAPAREDLRYDPIIVALHELGHALRLDHTTPAGSTTIGLPRDGDVMRPISQSGWHQTNLNATFDRNPNAADIGFATAAAGNPLPAPGALPIVGLGLFGASRRRRRPA